MTAVELMMERYGSNSRISEKARGSFLSDKNLTMGGQNLTGEHLESIAL